MREQKLQRVAQLQPDCHMPAGDAVFLRPRIQAVDFQLDFLAVAVEVRREELQETSETEQWTLERGRREADPGFPLATFPIAGYAQGHFRVSELNAN
jgi:hypothetical protein